MLLHESNTWSNAAGGRCLCFYASVWIAFLLFDVRSVFSMRRNSGCLDDAAMGNPFLLSWLIALHFNPPLQSLLFHGAIQLLGMWLVISNLFAWPQSRIIVRSHNIELFTISPAHCPRPCVEMPSLWHWLERMQLISVSLQLLFAYAHSYIRRQLAHGKLVWQFATSEIFLCSSTSFLGVPLHMKTHLPWPIAMPGIGTWPPPVAPLLPLQIFWSEWHYGGLKILAMT